MQIHDISDFMAAAGPLGLFALVVALLAAVAVVVHRFGFPRTRFFGMWPAFVGLMLSIATAGWMAGTIQAFKAVGAAASGHKEALLTAGLKISTFPFLITVACVIMIVLLWAGLRLMRPVEAAVPRRRSDWVWTGVSGAAAAVAGVATAMGLAAYVSLLNLAHESTAATGPARTEAMTDIAARSSLLLYSSELAALLCFLICAVLILVSAIRGILNTRRTNRLAASA